MLEQGKYPYKPGVGGIMLPEIKEGAGEIVGGSGRKLLYTAINNKLSIKDADMPSNYRLIATKSYIVLGLNVQTKGVHFPTGKHPDLYTARFLEAVIPYFDSRGERLQMFDARWSMSSDNFTSFFEALKTQSRVDAAKSTWSGRTVAKFGFTTVDPGDITITKQDKEPFHVSVMFRRTK